MRAHWCALHFDLMRAANRLRFQTEFIAFRQGHTALCDVRDPADLMDRLHTPGGDPDKRNDILHALVIVAQDETAPQTATTLLMLALWPGLDAVHGRLCRDCPQDRAEIGGDIVAQMTFGIRHLDLAAVHKIAATLIMNTERDLRRAYLRVARQRCAAVPLEEHTGITSVAAPDDPTGSPWHWEQLLPSVLGRDTALFVRIIRLGETQAEAARALGLSHDSARKRHQRAMQKLTALQKNLPGLSHSSERIGL